MDQNTVSYAQDGWRSVGAATVATRRSLETALDTAPRSIERQWVQEGRDAALARQAS